MITEKRKLLTYKWFCEAPEPELKTAWLHSPWKGNLKRHVRKNACTLFIDLQKDEEALLAAFSSTARNEVRRAGEEGLQYLPGSGEEELLKLGRKNAGFLALSGIDKGKLDSLRPHLFFSRILKNDLTLSAHAWLLDGDIKRAHLYYSASAFRLVGKGDKRQQVGRAHRLHHFLDMLQLKDRGMRICDLGGYNQGAALRGVNSFKKQFGGRPVEEYHYFPVYYMKAKKLRRWLGV